MNPKETTYNLGEGLIKAKSVLEKILVHVRGIDEKLKPLEQGLQEKEFISQGAFVRRNPNLIVCLPVTTPKEDRNFNQFSETVQENSSEPSIIWIDDYSESDYMCKRIAKLVETQFLELASKNIVLINLRISKMIQPFEAKPTLVMGKRFILDENDSLTKLTLNLKKTGLQVFYDYSEFGGGPLISTFLNTLQMTKDSIIVEMTLSNSAAMEKSCINSILDGFKLVWK
jgi:hypothetical protein